MTQKSDKQPYLGRVRVGAAKVVANLTETVAVGMRCPQVTIHLEESGQPTVRQVVLHYHAEILRDHFV
jgi:hypothetical protein